VARHFSKLPWMLGVSQLHLVVGRAGAVSKKEVAGINIYNYFPSTLCAVFYGRSQGRGAADGH
jgi:hypothetical protein